VRAAVEEAVGPLVARTRELEARLERAERTGGGNVSLTGASTAAVSTAAAKLAASGGGPSLPGPLPGSRVPSNPPPPLKAPAPPPPLPVQRAQTDAAPGSQTNPDGTTIPEMKAAAPYGTSTSAHPVGPRPSMPVNGYGVSVILSTRPTLDLESVGPINIDGFDGGRQKRRVAYVVVVVMVMIIVCAVTMSVLSHN
jgi:hypothetical protein